MGLGTVRENSCRILPKYGEDMKEEKKELRLGKQHKRKKRKDAAIEGLKERKKNRRKLLYIRKSRQKDGV